MVQLAVLDRTRTAPGRYMTELGMTPAARSRLSVAGAATSLPEAIKIVIGVAAAARGEPRADFVIGAAFTVVSLARSYLLRRLFEGAR